MQTWNDAINFIEETALYFEKAQTNGEDRAFWVYSNNAKNLRSIASLMRTRKDSLQVDVDTLNRCAQALVKQHQQYWPGSWPALPEAQGLTNAVIKEYLTTQSEAKND